MDKPSEAGHEYVVAQEEKEGAECDDKANSFEFFLSEALLCFRSKKPVFQHHPNGSTCFTTMMSKDSSSRSPKEVENVIQIKMGHRGNRTKYIYKNPTLFRSLDARESCIHSSSSGNIKISEILCINSNSSSSIKIKRRNTYIVCIREDGTILMWLEKKLDPVGVFRSEYIYHWGQNKQKKIGVKSTNDDKSLVPGNFLRSSLLFGSHGHLLILFDTGYTVEKNRNSNINDKTGQLVYGLVLTSPTTGNASASESLLVGSEFSLGVKENETMIKIGHFALHPNARVIAVGLLKLVESSKQNNGESEIQFWDISQVVSFDPVQLVPVTAKIKVGAEIDSLVFHDCLNLVFSIHECTGEIMLWSFSDSFTSITKSNSPSHKVSSTLKLNAKEIEPFYRVKISLVTCSRTNMIYAATLKYKHKNDKSDLVNNKNTAKQQQACNYTIDLLWVALVEVSNSIDNCSSAKTKGEVIFPMWAMENVHTETSIQTVSPSRSQSKLLSNRILLFSNPGTGEINLLSPVPNNDHESSDYKNEDIYNYSIRRVTMKTQEKQELVYVNSFDQKNVFFVSAQRGSVCIKRYNFFSRKSYTAVPNLNMHGTVIRMSINVGQDRLLLLVKGTKSFVALLFLLHYSAGPELILEVEKADDTCFVSRNIVGCLSCCHKKITLYETEPESESLEHCGRTFELASPVRRVFASNDSDLFLYVYDDKERECIAFASHFDEDTLTLSTDLEAALILDRDEKVVDLIWDLHRCFHSGDLEGHEKSIYSQQREKNYLVAIHTSHRILICKELNQENLIPICSWDRSSLLFRGMPISSPRYATLQSASFEWLQEFGEEKRRILLYHSQNFKGKVIGLPVLETETDPGAVRGNAPIHVCTIARAEFGVSLLRASSGFLWYSTTSRHKQTRVFVNGNRVGDVTIMCRPLLTQELFRVVPSESENETRNANVANILEEFLSSKIVPPALLEAVRLAGIHRNEGNAISAIASSKPRVGSSSFQALMGIAQYCERMEQNQVWGGKQQLEKWLEGAALAYELAGLKHDFLYICMKLANFELPKTALSKKNGKIFLNRRRAYGMQMLHRLAICSAKTCDTTLTTVAICALQAICPCEGDCNVGQNEEKASSIKSLVLGKKTNHELVNNGKDSSIILAVNVPITLTTNIMSSGDIPVLSNILTLSENGDDFSSRRLSLSNTKQLNSDNNSRAFNKRTFAGYWFGLNASRRNVNLMCHHLVNQSLSKNSGIESCDESILTGYWRFDDDDEEEQPYTSANKCSQRFFTNLCKNSTWLGSISITDISYSIVDSVADTNYTLDPGDGESVKYAQALKIETRNNVETDPGIVDDSFTHTNGLRIYNNELGSESRMTDGNFSIEFWFRLTVSETSSENSNSVAGKLIVLPNKWTLSFTKTGSLVIYCDQSGEEQILIDDISTIQLKRDGGWHHIAFVNSSDITNSNSVVYLDDEILNISIYKQANNNPDKDESILIASELRGIEVTEVRLWKSARSKSEIDEAKLGYLPFVDAKRKFMVVIQ